MSDDVQVSAQTDRKTDPPPDGNSSEEEPAGDPRVQDELNKLNQASGEINRLENELDEARTKYRSTVSEISNKMEAAAKSQKKSIRKARDYYRLETERKLAQAEALKAARQYQSATGIYTAAKETVTLAELRLTERDPNCGVQQLDTAWQETLNHAVSKVMEAELEKTRSEQEHRRRASKCAELESRVHFLGKKFNTSIKNAKPYFDLKSDLDLKLMQQKQNVNDLHAAIKSNKTKYTESLRTLESISEEIHKSRRATMWKMLPRMPCVGAETDTDSLYSHSSDQGLGSIEEDRSSDEDSGNEGDISSVDKCSAINYMSDNLDHDVNARLEYYGDRREHGDCVGAETDSDCFHRAQRSDTVVNHQSENVHERNVQRVRDGVSESDTELDRESSPSCHKHTHTKRNSRSHTIVSQNIDKESSMGSIQHKQDGVLNATEIIQSNVT